MIHGVMVYCCMVIQIEREKESQGIYLELVTTAPTIKHCLHLLFYPYEKSCFKVDVHIRHFRNKCDILEEATFPASQ